MRNGYEIAREDGEKIRAKMKEVTKKAICRRLEAVALLAEGKSPKEISQITKHNEKHVRQLGNRYHKEGLDALASDGRIGGNHRVMSEEASK